MLKVVAARQGLMLKRLMFRAVSRGLVQPVLRRHRGLTLGVRIAVLNGANEVFLVHHTYAPGWLFPGGGVERGETVHEAAARELREEGGIIAQEPLALHGLFSNEARFPGDHLACFILRAFTRENWTANLEIAEAHFFPLTALPAATTGGTERRIAEIHGLRPISPAW